MLRALALLLVLALILAGCGSGSSSTSTTRRQTASASASASSSQADLPGSGKPPLTIGDKNFTEQFVLGELYRQALAAQGYNVSLNRNIGPIEVTIPALESGRIDLYPEYLSSWNSGVAGIRRPFATAGSAWRAGARYARQHGLRLLRPTPFADTPALAVARAYAVQHRLHAVGDLARVPDALIVGGPPQFSQDPHELPALERAYGFTVSNFTPLEVGAQYQALDQGRVQAAEVNTTDGQLVAGAYRVLADPRRSFGWGNVVPVANARTLAAEGPALAATINRVDALLTPRVIRGLNAAVDVGGQIPAAVAKQFLQAHGLVPPAP